MVELVELVDDGDAVAAVGDLAGFDDPDVPGFVFLRMPLTFLLLLLILFTHLLPPLKIPHKLFILLILKSLLNMKSQRQIIEYILPK